MVLVSALLLAVIAVYKDRKRGADTFHALWGVGVLSLLLSILADFAPTIAGPFAVLTVLGSAASQKGGASIIDKVFGRSAPQSTSTHPTTTTAQHPGAN